jgi:hypothetical protein
MGEPSHAGDERLRRHGRRKPPELDAEDFPLFVQALPLCHFILLLSVESALWTRDFTVETGAERTSAISSRYNRFWCPPIWTPRSPRS